MPAFFKKRWNFKRLDKCKIDILGRFKKGEKTGFWLKFLAGKILHVKVNKGAKNKLDPYFVIRL